MSVFSAIETAERLLPGVAAPDGAIDPRWQVIIAVGEYVDSDPQLLLEFVRKWAQVDDADLRAALATCILEPIS